MTIADLIATDLALIADQAKWAHVHGLWKAGRGLDHEHGASTSKSEEDKDKGPTYDLEIGDHRSREAYQQACRAVHRADVLLADLLAEQGITSQPPITKLNVYSDTALLELATRQASWRVQHVEDLKNRRLSTIRTSLDRVVRALSVALDAGTADGIAHNETPCKTCKIRPRAEREKADGTKATTRHGECETCSKWRQRNRGETRPAAKLDGDFLNQAKAAKARRLARGEGWGFA